MLNEYFSQAIIDLAILLAVLRVTEKIELEMKKGLFRVTPQRKNSFS